MKSNNFYNFTLKDKSLGKENLKIKIRNHSKNYDENKSKYFYQENCHEKQPPLTSFLNNNGENLFNHNFINKREHESDQMFSKTK